jgi:uncharacterized membrane protein YecN with MAPEG domain
LGLIFIVLRIFVTIHRAKSGISILTQDNMILAEKVRRFGNFIETAPFVLILMGFVETSGANAFLLHTIGGLLLMSRILHPLGLNHNHGAHPLRIASGMMTLGSVLIAVIYILWHSFA